MSYLVVKPKSKKEEIFLKDLIEKLNVEYKKVSLKEYVREIAESRLEFKQGKKVSLTALSNGI